MIYPTNFETKIAFDRIRALLKQACVSTLGMERVDAMAFSGEYEEVDRRLRLADEMLHIVQGPDDFPSGGYHDLRPVLAHIRIAGTYMEVPDLFRLRQSLDTIGQIVRFLSQTEGEEGDKPLRYPLLHELCGGVAPFPALLKEIDKVLDAKGEVRDNASKALQDIRAEKARTLQGIGRILNGILRAAQAEGVVEKDVSPALRDGRLVIPVVPAMKRRLHGIVHDESASGKTVFIEPQQVVEANNRIRELEGEERREIIRILVEVADKVRPHTQSLQQAYELLAEIDFVRAKALLADRFEAVLPRLSPQPVLDWVQAVHPLLRQSLAKHGKEVVPLDIELGPSQRILLISGPNAGGKSVCLKTVGLLQYMLQCGLLIPIREGGKAGIFRHIFIDIGDEQSIDNDLSTYSSHLLNMKHMLRYCDPTALVLIDEFGGGTEPGIGGAIAQATLRRLNDKGTYGIITTHYQNLKQFADEAPGIVNCAMLYDRGEMRPLFKLQIGHAGSSFAIEIARKIGLPQEVIDEAADIVGQDYVNTDKYVQDIARDKRYWENKRQSIHQKEKKLDEQLAAYAAQLEELRTRTKEVMKQAREEAGQLLDTANAQIENTIRTIKENQAEKEKTRQARQELNAFREAVEKDWQGQAGDIDRQMERVRKRQERRDERKRQKPAVAPAPAPAKKAEWKVGDTVKLKGQSAPGTILEIHGKNILVAFGNLKSTVKAADLQPAQAAAAPAAPSHSGSTRQAEEVLRSRQLSFKQEIDVRGMRAEEAIQAVSYFIDDAVMLGISKVRILHGTGTGALREAIRQQLAVNPVVRHYADEHVQLGGAGITVVDLD